MSSDSNEPLLRVCLAHRVGSGCPDKGLYMCMSKTYGPSAYQRLCPHCGESFLVDRAKVRVCPEKHVKAMISASSGRTLDEYPGFRDSPPLPGSPSGSFQFCLCNHLPLKADKSGPVQGPALVLLLHARSAPTDFPEFADKQPDDVPEGKVRLYVDRDSRTFRPTRGRATTARRRSSNQRIPVVVPVVVGPGTSAGGAAPDSTLASPSGEYTSPSPERGGAPGEESDQAIFDDISEWASAILDDLDHFRDHTHILTISKMPAKARKKLAGELRRFADRLEEIDNRAVVDRNGSQEEQAAFEELQDEFREVLTLRSSAGGSSNPAAQHESPSSSSSDEDCLTYR